MTTLEQLTTHPTPGGRAQPIAFHQGTLWLGSWDADRLFAIDPATWSVTHEVEIPGKPYGLASLGDALWIVVAMDDDDRYLLRSVAGEPIDVKSRIACPQLTGSHLTSNGTSLFLVQQGLGKILEIDIAGKILRETALPTRCAGVAIDAGVFYMISADDEFDVLELASIDIESGSQTLVKIAPMNAEARGLAFDGTAWWTNLREIKETISFRV